MKDTAKRPTPLYRRVLLAGAITVAVLVGGAYAATAVMEIPPPHTLYNLAKVETSRRGDVFPTRIVPASSHPIAQALALEPMDATVPWHGKTIPVQAFLDTTRTKAFVVLRDGKIVHEWYAKDAGPELGMSSQSVAKSTISLLVGQAIGRGQLHESDRLVDLIPEFRTGQDYDKVTVGHLLDMASGIDVSENYNPLWPYTGTARMYLTTDLPGFYKSHRTLAFEPGSKSDYRSVDTGLLGLILERVTGKHVADLLAQDLWGPIGASHSFGWNLDRPDGVEKAFCCVNATARDYARIGQLVLDRGRVGERQVVPEAWISRISKSAMQPYKEWGYSAQWWHPVGGDGADLTAIGIYGQFIYVDPTTRTVIVKLSDYETDKDEVETIGAFRAIAARGAAAATAKSKRPSDD